MEKVYEDIAEAWKYLKRGKAGTAFLYVKPKKITDAPWVFMGKRSIVAQRAKRSYLADAADFYLLTKVVTGIVHRDGQTLVLVPDEPGDASDLTAWITRAPTALMRGARAAKELGGGAAEAASDMRKLGAALKSAVVKETLDGEVAEAADLEEEEDGLDPREEEALQLELDQELTQADVAAAFGADSEAVSAAVVRASAALAQIQKLEDGLERDLALVEFMEAINEDGELPLEHVSDLVAAFAVTVPTSSSRSLQEGEPLDDEELALMVRSLVTDVRTDDARASRLLEDLEGLVGEADELTDAHEQWVAGNPGHPDSATRLETLNDELAAIRRKGDAVLQQVARLQGANRQRNQTLAGLLGL
jgi:hypothetical protein